MTRWAFIRCQWLVLLVLTGLTGNFAISHSDLFYPTCVETQHHASSAPHEACDECRSTECACIKGLPGTSRRMAAPRPVPILTLNPAPLAASPPPATPRVVSFASQPHRIVRTAVIQV